MPNLDQFIETPGKWSGSYSNPEFNGYSFLSGTNWSKREWTVRTSMNTADYFNLATKRRLPTNNFSFAKTIVMGAYGTAIYTTYDKIPRVTTKQGCLEGESYSIYDAVNGASLSSADIIAFDNMARTSLLLKMKDQKVNLAQVYAERHLTASMVADTAIKLVNTMRNLRKGNFRAAADGLGLKVSRRSLSRFNGGFRKNQSKAIANGWLELQYGWKPLLQDVYGAAEAISASRTGGPPVVRISSKKQAKRTNVVVDKPKTEELDSATTGTVEYTVKYVVYYSVGNELLQKGTALGLTNPASIAWELTPYSFVVDWFFPIGNWISSLDATNGCVFMGGSKTVFQKRITHKIWYGSKPRVADRKSGGAEGYLTKITCDRSKLEQFPMTGVPQFKNPISLQHAANGLALLTQLFKK